jgi:hypothetical protein
VEVVPVVTNNISAKPSYIHYIRRARLTSTTQIAFEPLSLHLYFTIFGVVRSLAKLVIEDQEHLEDIWYDQYNGLHCDSCHVVHLVLVLILSI